MNLMHFCLILLSLLVLSGILSRLLYFIPTPLIQVLVGMLIGILLPQFHQLFNPELFMLLFIPPLLFSDSWRFPKREFMAYKRPIILLAIGLVLFTVFGIGYLFHWLVAAPLAACFAAAAALAPTDAVSLKSLTAHSGLPSRLTHILQGESLLNDASGLVAFKLSAAALLTGYFSWTEASVKMIIVSCGALFVGVALTFLFVLALGQISSKNHSETCTENLFIILLPYAAYISAEYCGFSGIIAAVAAGFSLDWAGFMDKTLMTMRIEGYFVWGMIEMVLNGIVFILLGLYLPHSLELISNTGVSIGQYWQWVLIITLTLAALRVLWVYLTLPFEALLAHHRNTELYIPNLKLVLTLAFGGVRGTITLAAILSLPVWMPDGAHVPQRTLLITLVVGVIFFSLLLSALFLTIITPFLQNMIEKLPAEEEQFARIAAAKAAIKAIEEKMHRLSRGLNQEEEILCIETGNNLTASLSYFINSGIGNKKQRALGRKALYFERTLRNA
ncbi:MAG: Na+/H+ antiporter, partial [Legionella sp. 40-6]